MSEEKKKIRKYFYEKDEKGLNLYDAKYDKNINYKYHYNVLPHPYFGDIENAQVIFLAKNPSYSEFEDEYDTWKFFEDTKNDQKILNVDQYDKYLKETFLLNPFKDGNNKSFFNSWKWWNKKVIGHVECNKIQPKDVAFINLCGYQSKEFVEFKYENGFEKNWFGCSKNSDIFKKIINKKDVFFVIVWGRKEWSNFLNRICENEIEKDFFEEKLSGNFIVLNQYKSKSNEIKSGRKINSLEMILKPEVSKTDFYEIKIKEKLGNFFKLKPENDESQ